MKIKLMKNKKDLQQKFSRKVLVPLTTADFTSKVSTSHGPFTCKFHMEMLCLHKRCCSKTDFNFFFFSGGGVVATKLV